MVIIMDSWRNELKVDLVPKLLFSGNEEAIRTYPTGYVSLFVGCLNDIKVWGEKFIISTVATTVIHTHLFISLAILYFFTGDYIVNIGYYGKRKEK